MPDGLEIRVDGLTINGRPGLGPFVVVKDGLDGWDDGVSMRGDKAARPQAHGSFVLPRWQESRTVTINGIILARNAAEQELLGNRLSGLLVGGSEGRVQVSKGGKVQWAMASLDSCSVDPRRGETRSDFQLQLWCADARKYGDSKTYAVATGSPVNVSHRGNYNAMPSFIIRGDMPGGYTITVDGWNYTVTRALVAGAPHRVDYNNGRLYVNGTLTQGNLGNTNRAPIPPGQSVGVGLYPVTTGSGSADMTVIDTYI